MDRDALSADVHYASGYIAIFVTMPALRRYVELSFTDTYLARTQTEQLARCPHLQHLEHLGLYNTSLGDEDLVPIFSAFPNLLSLDIGNGRDEQDWTLEGLRRIVDAPFAAALRVLSMPGRWVGDDVVDVIAKLPALVDLDLSRSSLTDAGVIAFTRLPNRFNSLALVGNDFGEAGLQALRQQHPDLGV